MLRPSLIIIILPQNKLFFTLNKKTIFGEVENAAGRCAPTFQAAGLPSTRAEEEMTSTPQTT